MTQKHSLFRLASTIWNTPQLITISAFTPILNYLDGRNHSIYIGNPQDLPGAPVANSDDDTDPLDNDPNEGFSLINIDGSLSYKPVQAMCSPEGCSYTSLVEQFEEAIENGTTTIVMNISSGGGQAAHCFESATDCRQMCDAAGVKLLAYVDTLACSAALAWAVIADEVIANPSSTTGSVGCVVALMDESKALAQAGLKPIFVTSGTNKVPYTADGSFSESFLADIQESVDELNQEFTAFVNKYTGIDTQTIIDWQAKTFSAQAALEVGLINKIMTNREFASYAVSVHQGAQNA